MYSRILEEKGSLGEMLEENSEQIIHTLIVNPKRLLIKNMLQVAIPLLVVSLNDIAIDILANTIIVGFNNKDSAAVNLIAPIRAITLTTFSGVILVTSNLVSEAKSSHDFLLVGRTYRQSMLVSLIFSVPPVIILASMREILNAFKQTEYSVSCEEFFKYFTFSVPAYCMLSATQQTLLGLKKPWLILSFNLPSLLLFYGLAHILANQLEMKMHGVSLAYVVRSWSLLGAYHLYLKCNKGMQDYRFFSFENKAAEWTEFKKIMRLGLPVVIDILGESSAFFMLTLIVGWMGSNASSLQNVNSQYIIFSLTPSLVLAKSAGIWIADSLHNNPHEVRRYGNFHLSAAVIAMTGLSILAISLTSPLISLFIPENERHVEGLENTVRTLLAITSVAEIFDSIHNVLTGALRGLHDTTFPAITNNLSLWGVAVPLAYYLSTVQNMGVKGIALGHSVGLAVSNILLLPRWWRKSNPSHLNSIPVNTKNNWGSCLNFFRKKATRPDNSLNEIQLGSQSLPQQSQDTSEFNFSNRVD